MVIGLFLAIAGPATYPATVNSGESLVKEMHGRYAASWYPAVTFTQKRKKIKKVKLATVEKEKIEPEK